MKAKFRCWDAQEKKMVFEGFHVFGEVTIFHLIDQYCFETKGDKDTLERYNDLVEMQFIGLSDKMNKDIYEGDIGEIRSQSGRVERFIVEWGIHRREMKSGWTVDIPGFSFIIDGRPTFPIVNNYVNGHDLDIIEVIGNIYENPELIHPS